MTTCVRDNSSNSAQNARTTNRWAKRIFFAFGRFDLTLFSVIGIFDSAIQSSFSSCYPYSIIGNCLPLSFTRSSGVVRGCRASKATPRSGGCHLIVTVWPGRWEFPRMRIQSGRVTKFARGPISRPNLPPPELPEPHVWRAVVHLCVVASFSHA